MAQNNSSFSDRLQRIEGGRAPGILRAGGARPSTPGIVVHPDGFTEPVASRRKRLRFGFPLKGVVFATVLAVLVKAYLIWTLGDDVYGAAVAQLLSGSQLERAAGLVLAPDTLSNWLVDVYQQIYRFVVSVATALEIGTPPDLA